MVCRRKPVNSDGTLDGARDLSAFRQHTSSSACLAHPTPLQTARWCAVASRSMEMERCTVARVVRFSPAHQPRGLLGTPCAFLHSSVTLCLGLLIATAAVAGEAKVEWAVVDGVRLPLPPAEHPRLYLRRRARRRTAGAAEASGAATGGRAAASARRKSPQFRVEWDALQYLVTHDEKLGRAIDRRRLAAAPEVRTGRPPGRLPRDRPHDGHRRDRLRLAATAC